MRQTKIWVVTFDGACSRAFAYNGVPRRLEEIAGERRSGQHKPEFDDRAGRVYSSMGAQRSGVSHHTDPERRMEDGFVASLVEHLAAEATGKSFDELIVAASPRALGAFRAHAPKVLADKVIREVHGDYVNDDPKRLLAALAK